MSPVLCNKVITAFSHAFGIFSDSRHLLNRAVIALTNVSPPNLMASMGTPSSPGDFLFFISITAALTSSSVMSGNSSDPTFLIIGLSR